MNVCMPASRTFLSLKPTTLLPVPEQLYLLFLLLLALFPKSAWPHSTPPLPIGQVLTQIQLFRENFPDTLAEAAPPPSCSITSPYFSST